MTSKNKSGFHDLLLLFFRNTGFFSSSWMYRPKLSRTKIQIVELMELLLKLEFWIWVWFFCLSCLFDLLQHKLFSCIHKHYTVQEWIDFATENPETLKVSKQLKVTWFGHHRGEGGGGCWPKLILQFHCLKGKFPQTTMWIGWLESNVTNPTGKVWADCSDYAKLCMSPSLDGLCQNMWYHKRTTLHWLCM